MLTLNVYAGLFKPAPNRGRSTYLIGDAGYILPELGTPAIQLTEHNFTYEYNEIFIPGKYFKAVYPDTLTYAVIEGNDEATQTYIFRAFFIDAAHWESNGVRCSLTLDKWGTYIGSAAIKQIKITRCNRRIAGGVFDEIEAPEAKTSTFENLPAGGSFGDVCVVFAAVNANAASTIFVNKSSTNLNLYKIPIDKNGTFKTVSEALDAVAGIYAVEASGAGTLDAGVLRAFLVPSQMVLDAAEAMPVFKTISKGYSGKIGPDQGMQVVQKSRLVKSWQFDFDNDYSYRFGTWWNSMPVPRTFDEAGQITLKVNFLAKRDGMQVILQVNESTQDITEAFSVGLTTNDGNITSLDRVAQTLSLVGNISSALEDSAKGDYFSAGMTVADSAVNAVIKPRASYSPAGDGLTTWADAFQNSPFYVRKNKSICDEHKRVNLNGAQFARYVDNLNGLTAFPLLGGGTAETTFIQCDCEVEGVPADAADYIKQQFAKGIFIKNLG